MARLLTIYFACRMTTEFFSKFKYIFYNSIWLTMVCSEFINVH